MRSPIHSEKHYVQQTISTVAVTALGNFIILDAVAIADKDAANEVTEGSVVRAVYVELWWVEASDNGGATLTIGKYPSGLSGPSYAQNIALNTFDNKNNILFCTQGLIGNDGVDGPSCAFKGWIKIPKGKQRMSLGDRIVASIANHSASSILSYCGFAVFKEYS